MEGYAVCIGASVFDLKAIAFEPVHLGTSNPVKVVKTPGGVARNLAENLLLRGKQANLITCIGADGEGDQLVAHMKKIGLDVETMAQLPGWRTGSYTALLNPSGDMIVAMADMEINDALLPPLLEIYLDLIKEASLIIIDSNLPLETMHWIAARASNLPPIWGCSVSLPKMKRFAPLLPHFDLLFLNREELFHLAQARGELSTICKKIKGPKAMVISLGEQGAALFENDTLSYFSAQTTEVVDVSGAGDALCTGVAEAFLEGLTLHTGIERGMTLATKALQTLLSTVA